MRRGAGGGSCARIRRHEGELVVVVQTPDRVLGREPGHQGVVIGGIPGETSSGRLLPGFDVPLVGQLLVGARVDAEVGTAVRQEVGEALVDLDGHLAESSSRPPERSDPVDGDPSVVGRRHRQLSVVGVPEAPFGSRGIGVSDADRRGARPIAELTSGEDDRLYGTLHASEELSRGLGRGRGRRENHRNRNADQAAQRPPLRSHPHHFDERAYFPVTRQPGTNYGAGGDGQARKDRRDVVNGIEELF